MTSDLNPLVLATASRNGLRIFVGLSFQYALLGFGGPMWEGGFAAGAGAAGAAAEATAAAGPSGGMSAASVEMLGSGSKVGFGAPPKTHWVEARCFSSKSQTPEL